MERGEFDGSRLEAVENRHSNPESEKFLRELGLEMSDLEGKKVLSIGGIPQGDVAIEAKQAGMDFITVNPGFDNEDYTKPKAGPQVSGLSQELPFANESFDVALAHASVPGYLPKIESEYRAMFSEMLRILKPGGEAYIYPITDAMYNDEVFEEIVHSHVDGAKFEFEPMEKREIQGEYQQVYRLNITKSEKNG